MNKISMVIEARTLDKIKVDDIGVLTFGGFSFKVGEDYIPFDWEAFTTCPYQNEDGTVKLEYQSGRGFLFNEYTLDPCYIDQYEDMNIDIEDIDAQMLASVDCIEELFHEFYLKEDKYEEHCVPILIESISFLDCNDWDNVKEYHVDREVIKRYNNTMLGGLECHK